MIEPTTDPRPQPQQYKFARIILLVALVGVGFGFTVLFAILGPLGREVGLSELQISSVIAASSLTVFLASPRWGRLSDRWGRKPVMIFGLLGYACGNFLICERISRRPDWCTVTTQRLLITNANPSDACQRDVGNYASEQRLYGRYYRSDYAH